MLTQLLPDCCLRRSLRRKLYIVSYNSPIGISYMIPVIVEGRVIKMRSKYPYYTIYIRTEFNEVIKQFEDMEVYVIIFPKIKR